MEIMIREIAVSDYPDVVWLWNEVLGNTVDNENFTITIISFIYSKLQRHVNKATKCLWLC